MFLLLPLPSSSSEIFEKRCESGKISKIHEGGNSSIFFNSFAPSWIINNHRNFVMLLLALSLFLLLGLAFLVFATKVKPLVQLGHWDKSNLLPEALFIWISELIQGKEYVISRFLHDFIPPSHYVHYVQKKSIARLHQNDEHDHSFGKVGNVKIKIDFFPSSNYVYLNINDSRGMTRMTSINGLWKVLVHETRINKNMVSLRVQKETDKYVCNLNIDLDNDYENTKANKFVLPLPQDFWKWKGAWENSESPVYCFLNTLSSQRQKTAKDILNTSIGQYSVQWVNDVTEIIFDYIKI